MSGARRVGALPIALAITSALGASAAVASDLVTLHGPWLDPAAPVAFRAGLDYRWQHRALDLLRELDCVAHERIDGAELCPDASRIGLARDLRAESFTSTLDLDLRATFIAAIDVRLRLPFVVSDAATLDFDAGVDGRNSQTAPYNAPALFDVPYRTTRGGLADPVIGIWAALLSSARDPADPNLTVGVELTIPLAAPRTPGGASVGGDAWAVTLAVAGSERALPWLEPFFRLDATFTVPASDALYPDLGGMQTTRGPPDQVAARFGVELIPFERPARGHAVRLELGGELRFVTAGKSATELFDALGESECSLADDPPCPLTTHAVGTTATGMTIAEEYLAGGLWLGAHYDLHQSFRVTARARFGWESPRFLTASNLGLDFDGGGVQAVNSFGANEHDPDYNPHLDAPGARFRASDVSVLGIELSVTGRF